MIADTHFGHQGVCNFTRADGSPLRPWDTAAEMDKALIENWNSLVSDEDRVYLLGDVSMSTRGLDALYLVKGRKVLVKGNHDVSKLPQYTRHFDDIRAYVVGKIGDSRDHYILSHIPIHPQSLGERFKVNIHGHLHANRILMATGQPDERYQNVSVEQTNFSPILLQDVIKRVL